MSDLKITHAGTEVLQTNTGPINPLATLGQAGSIFVDDGITVKPPAGKAIVAITFLTEFLVAALIAEDPDKFVNTATAAHNLSGGSETSLEGSAGVAFASDVAIPAGITIYGRWTSFTGTAGDTAIAYIG